MVASEAKTALHDLVTSLHSDYEVWYAKSVRRLYRTFLVLQSIVLLSGFLTAILAAVMSSETFGNWGKLCLVVFPAIGSLAATFLVQFRTYDLWRIRELGRINFQELALVGRKAIVASNTDEECIAVLTDLQNKITAIEKSQGDSFFELFRSDFIAEYTVSQPNVERK